jgi:hypothetical protein
MVRDPGNSLGEGRQDHALGQDRGANPTTRTSEVVSCQLLELRRTFVEALLEPEDQIHEPRPSPQPSVDNATLCFGVVALEPTVPAQSNILVALEGHSVNGHAFSA